MNQPVHEIVVYRVSDPVEFDRVRAAAQHAVRAMPGWLGWNHFTSREDPASRVDLVTWRGAEAARTAAQEVGQSERFAAFRSGIAEVNSFGHYHLGEPRGAGLGSGMGVEFGRFTLKPGKDEAAMRAAHRAMVDGHLSLQQGWIGEWLIALDDGRFVDLVVAESEARARQICSSWSGQPLCEAFLDYVADPDQAFGTVR